jgi:hypothetical protein
MPSIYIVFRLLALIKYGHQTHPLNIRCSFSIRKSASPHLNVGNCQCPWHPNFMIFSRKPANRAGLLFVYLIPSKKLSLRVECSGLRLPRLRRLLSDTFKLLGTILAKIIIYSVGFRIDLRRNAHFLDNIFLGFVHKNRILNMDQLLLFENH